MASFFVCEANNVRPIPLFDSKTSPAFHKSSNDTITSHIQQCPHCAAKYGSSTTSNDLSVPHIHNEMYLSPDLVSIPDPPVSRSISPRVECIGSGSISPVSPITDHTPQTVSVELPKYAPSRSGTLTGHSLNSPKSSMLVECQERVQERGHKMDKTDGSNTPNYHKLHPPPIIHDVSDNDTVCRALEGVDDSKLFGDFNEMNDSKVCDVVIVDMGVDADDTVHLGSVDLPESVESQVDLPQDHNDNDNDSDDPMNLSRSGSVAVFKAISGDISEHRPPKYRAPPRHRFNKVTGRRDRDQKNQGLRHRESTPISSSNSILHPVQVHSFPTPISGKRDRPQTKRIGDRRQMTQIQVSGFAFSDQSGDENNTGTDKNRNGHRLHSPHSPSRPYSRVSPRTQHTQRRRANKRNRMDMLMISTPSPSPRKGGASAGASPLSGIHRMVIDEEEEKRDFAVIPAFSDFSEERLRKKQKRDHRAISRKLHHIQQERKLESESQETLERIPTGTVGLDLSRDTEPESSEDSMDLNGLNPFDPMNVEKDVIRIPHIPKPRVSFKTDKDHKRSKHSHKSPAKLSLRNTQSVNHYRSKRERKRHQLLSDRHDHHTLTETKVVEKVVVHEHHHHHHHHHHGRRSKSSKSSRKRRRPQTMKHTQHGHEDTFFGDYASSHPLKSRKSESKLALRQSESHHYYQHHHDHDGYGQEGSPSQTITPIFTGKEMDPIEALYSGKSVRLKSPSPSRRKRPKLRLYPHSHSYHPTDSDHNSRRYSPQRRSLYQHSPQQRYSPQRDTPQRPMALDESPNSLSFGYHRI